MVFLTDLVGGNAGADAVRKKAATATAEQQQQLDINDATKRAENWYLQQNFLCLILPLLLLVMIHVLLLLHRDQHNLHPIYTHQNRQLVN